MREVSCITYWAFVHRIGGLKVLKPLSSYTFIDEITCPFGNGVHVYTEWGKNGVPACESERHGSEITYRINEAVE